MKIKNVLMISLIIMIVTIIFMGINRFIYQFSDNEVRAVGFIMLIDLFIISYNAVKLRNNRN